MIWHQTFIELPPLPRGFNLVTNEILAQAPDLANCEVGLLNLFIQHTSASLAINENADPDVRGDLERHFNVMVPEHADYYEHTLEGPDDTTSHIKSVMIGPSLNIPVTRGHLALGTWQGIYLCEHRNRASGRRIVATLQGRW
ncbi:secondary thiamine-phosphate synthase enzyme YjbQ [Marinobacter daepoensis]|uniref:YjbQ family protein n=1 Tax=Marinobacter daepoensis TaxID=262077 RepID=A0ABS3BL96_9GAMM|nr:secondary thiamine-phosphate synthase enzyme YjbQ [Marinobacter daepoensis]MBN7771492.1 YjbQ family protein [Marinobacter daepoensis]MBY6034238.1 secondary thiamine-phosphate synthase enzyme YjbQ [Marinobacter daepoensis]MBY6080092.1 secondary thiamine-phosphate synthase enzyme YjbQ [Marinobacter daepoensis]